MLVAFTTRVTTPEFTTGDPTTMFSRIFATTLILATGAIALAAFVPPRHQDPAMEKPNAHHERVLDGAGTWKGTLTSFMPGGPDEPIAAREVAVPVGKFWVNTRFECDYMGMPYVGTGVLGYSAMDDEYVGTWTDSMSSYFALMKGRYDAERDLLVMRWNAPDMTGKMSPHRYELAMRDDGYTSTFFVGEGEGTKSMVIEMERVAAAGTGEK